MSYTKKGSDLSKRNKANICTNNPVNNQNNQNDQVNGKPKHLEDENTPMSSIVSL